MLFASVFMGLASAQSILHKIHDADPNISLGERLACAGDLDLDGVGDFLVRANVDETGGIVGSIRAYSGFDASQILTVYGVSSSGGYFGRDVANAGDVDADGVPDIIVGASDHPNGRAYVYSGLDGSLLYTFVGETAGEEYFKVDGAGDVNADGFADLIVGGRRNNYGGTNSGIVHVYSGLDGSVLYTYLGSGPSHGVGTSVAGVGDLNGDGHADFAFGAPGVAGPVGAHQGQVRVHSGADGSLLYSWFGNTTYAGLGRWVAGAGDVDGDGVPDVVAGATGDTSIGFTSGNVRVFSGATGLTIHEWTGTTLQQSFGWFVTGMGDLDGDGHADVGVLSMLPERFASIFSGGDGGLMYILNSETMGRPIVFVNGAGDVNGDGRDDIVAGTFWSPSPGFVLVLSGSEHFFPYCFGAAPGASCPCGNPGGADEGCANSSGVGATLSASGSTSLEKDNLVFSATQLIAGQAALCFAGDNALGGGAGIPFGDGLRCIGGDLRRLGVRAADGSGGASWGPGLAGPQGWSTGPRRFQIWYRDPAPDAPCGSTFNLSNAFEISFGF